MIKGQVVSSYVFEHIHRWRSDTPGIISRIHLNNAGAALMPKTVSDKIHEVISQESQVGGYETADQMAMEITETYKQIGELINASSHNIAIVENATVAIQLVLSTIAFQKGDLIITTKNDYVSNQLMFLSLSRRLNVRIMHADELPDGGVDADSVRRLADNPACKLVCVSWIPTNSGLIQDVEAIGKICKEFGKPFLVDACQAVGQIPIDVKKIKCDYLAASARKYLRGPRGIGFLYISNAALSRGDYPIFIDARGSSWVQKEQFILLPDARRFENWEFSYALVAGLGTAALYANSINIIETFGYVSQLANYTRDKLREIEDVYVLDTGVNKCGIVSAKIDGCDCMKLQMKLRQHRINTSYALREWALIDMDAKNAHTALRISPHYYNTYEEIDMLVESLNEIINENRKRTNVTLV